MTNTDALALEPGNRIQLRPQPILPKGPNPPGRTVYTVAKVDCRARYSE